MNTENFIPIMNKIMSDYVPELIEQLILDFINYQE